MAYTPAGRWSASAEQCDVGTSANLPDRQTLRISRSQMPLTSRGLDRDRDRSTKVPIPQKTGLDRSKTAKNRSRPVWTVLDQLLVLTGLNRFKTGL